MKRLMVVCLLACACGSSNSGSPDSGTPPTGSGSISGTVGGKTLVVKDAVFGIDPGSKLVTVVAADRTDICTLLAGTTLPAGTTTVLGFAMFNWLGTINTDAVAGDYAWLDVANLTGNPAAGKWWSGAFVVPTSCTTGTVTDATGGTATITQMGTSTGTHLKVTLTNFAFGTDTLNGTIEAIYCAAATPNPSCGAGLLARPMPVQ